MFEGVKVTDLTIEHVKEYLRIDGNDEDQALTTMLAASKSYLQSYLKQKFTEFDELPDEFTIACLALVAHWYERREIQSAKDVGNEAPYIFSALLDLHRVWN